MYEEKFTNWILWDDRCKLENLDLPGIYVIRISKLIINNKKFSWHDEIAYIGMTNAVKGLKSRLKAFDNTISGGRGHGGADRFRYEHKNYSKLVSQLYVSVASFQTDVTSLNPRDLRVMGSVAKFEYQCFAEYVENYGSLPEFNDKKKSKKYSLTYGKK